MMMLILIMIICMVLHRYRHVVDRRLYTEAIWALMGTRSRAEGVKYAVI